jgi:integrase
MRKAELGAYEAKWNLSEGLLPARLRRSARQMLGRIVKLGEPVTADSVDAMMRQLQHDRSTPGSVREGLSSLRAALEVIEPGRFGPLIIAAERAAVRVDGPSREALRTQASAPAPRDGLAVADWPAEKRDAWHRATGENGGLAHLSKGRLDSIRSALGFLYLFQQTPGMNEFGPATWQKFVEGCEARLAPSTLANNAACIYVAERTFLEMAQEHSVNDEFGDADAILEEDDEEFYAADEFIDDDEEFADADATMAGAIDDGKLGWLLREVRRLRRLAVRAGPVIDKMQFRVPLLEVYQAGLDTMDEAEAMPYGNAACLLYRAGWLTAFLSGKPVRIGTAAATDVSQGTYDRGHLEFGTDGKLYVRWPAGAVKNRKEILGKVIQELVPRTERWLKHYRTGLYGADQSDAFFVGNHGGPVTAKALRRDFESVMFRRFKKRIPPHMIRSIVAAFVAEEAPLAALAGITTDLLDHSSPREDEPYRGMIRADLAQDRLAAAMSGLKRSGSTELRAD